jgi:hypothetical protein
MRDFNIQKTFSEVEKSINKYDTETFKKNQLKSLYHKILYCNLFSEDCRIETINTLAFIKDLST